MGGVWLGSLPQVLADAGLVVATWSGWETRSRSSGGYDAVWAVGVHHDAATTGTSLEARCRYAWESSGDRPVGAVWLHTDGTWMVGAAGATNTQGKGGPTSTSKGTIPADAGNRYMLSIEASNNGVGEVWPDVMLDAYRRGCAALCRWLTLDPTRDVVAHFEWTTRKIDPAGNSRYATGGNSWDMGLFRNDIANVATPPQPPSEDDEMKLFACVDSNGTVWVGDGITRRYVSDWPTWELMVLMSLLGSGPKIHASYDVGVLITDPAQVSQYVYDPPSLNALGLLLAS